MRIKDSITVTVKTGRTNVATHTASEINTLHAKADVTLVYGAYNLPLITCSNTKAVFGNDQKSYEVDGMGNICTADSIGDKVDSALADVKKGLMYLLGATSLNDLTWDKIKEISDAGLGASFFSVGDTKAIALSGTCGTLALDTTLYCYILGFDHNSGVEGKGISFGTFKDADGKDMCLVDANYNTYKTDGTKAFNMNHWGNYNYGGWAACDMRYDILGSTDQAPANYGSAKASGATGNDPTNTCATNPVANTLMSCLPSELRAVMKAVTKYTDNTGGASNKDTDVTTTSDYLPLLSEFEIFGAWTYANESEYTKQKQYEYYAKGNSRIKNRHDTGVAARWWERSASCYGTTAFCFVSTRGAAGNHDAHYSLGLAPAFLI